MNRLKIFFASLFIAGWFLIVGPIIAHAEESATNQVQSSPSDTPKVTTSVITSDTSTITVTVFLICDRKIL